MSLLGVLVLIMAATLLPMKVLCGMALMGAMGFLLWSINGIDEVLV